MSRGLAALVLPALLLVTAGGCATARPGVAFEEARDDLEQRTGAAVEWAGVSVPAEEVRGRVDELLAEELTADEAAAVALLNNRRLQATYGRLGIAAAELAQASRIPNPVLEAVLLLEGGDTDLLELSLVTEFLDALLLPLRKRLARDAYEIARLEVTTEAVRLAAETRRAMVGLQADLQALEMLRTALLATEASHEMATRLYEAGNVSRLERLRERDLLEQTKLEVAEAEMGVLAGRERLNRLMGLWGPTAMTWQPAPRLPHPSAEDDLEGLEGRAVEASLALAVSFREVERAARRAGLDTLTAVTPELKVGVAGERETGEGGDHEWAVGPLLELPLPLFDQGQPRRARARAEIRRLWDDYTATAVEVRSAARDTALRLRYARGRADYARDVTLPLRQQITYETQLHYNAMFLGVFELLEAKRREIDAGLAYIDALEGYWSARADLGTLLAGVSPTGDRGNAGSPSAVERMGMDTEGDH